MSNSLPRLHPEDLAEIVKSLSADTKQELRDLYSRENVIKDMITLDIDEVALILKKNPQTISKYCQKKIIPSFKSGTEWRITQQSLKEYMNVIKK